MVSVHQWFLYVLVRIRYKNRNKMVFLGINFFIFFCLIPETYSRSSVAVISFPRYCRYRATLKRLEGVSDEWLRKTLVQALCGFVSYGPDTRVMFCKVRILNEYWKKLE